MDWLLISAMSGTEFLATASMVAKTALGLGFVIFIHELGHFLAAKACGVKCEKFYVGFDPPMSIFGIKLPRHLGKFQWGETEYGIGIIPLGGYVKMLGQDDDPRLASQEAERERIRNSRESQVDDSEFSQAESDAQAETQAVNEVALDPRSYPAKSVPQRMLIISAGVLMNLISAVFIAAWAYSLGVSFLPCELAGATPGDPAWVANVDPGDKLIQVGKDGTPDEHLRFLWELRQRVAYEGIRGTGEPMELLVRKADGREVWLAVTPSKRTDDDKNGDPAAASIGVFGPQANELAMSNPVYFGGSAIHADPPFQGGDRIVAINGQEIDFSNKNEIGLVRAEQIESKLHVLSSETVTITVVRKRGEGKEATEQRVDIRLAPTKYRSPGCVLKMGPIVSIRSGSPAEKAGVRVGDVIEAIDGEPIVDPMTLPFIRGYIAGDETVLTLRRGSGNKEEVLDLTLKPTLPKTRPPTMWPRGALLSLESLGVAYSVPLTVQSVDEDAVVSGTLQPGDKLLNAKFVLNDSTLKEPLAEIYSSALFSEPLRLSENVWSWPRVIWLMQELPAGMQLELTVERNKAAHTVVLASQETDHFFPTRGLRFGRFERVHVAESLGDAMSLGARETKEKFNEVLSFLGLLVQGKISPKHLGGPIRIAQLAGSEASHSLARLLLFLTFLSCNLAIVNFLPIPALDGGHMVFLMWELVTGRPPNEQFQMMATLIGFVFLLSLMVFVIGNDIFQSF